MQDLTATRVSIPGVIGPYDAYVHLGDQWNGFARPLFALDTVREIAAHTQILADEGGCNSVVTAHVIDGDPDSEGMPRAVVLTVNWQFWDQDGGASKVTTVAESTAEGLYPVGGSSWTWEIETWTCACQESNPWHLAVCHCGQPRDRQPAVPLEAATWTAGATLRRLAPGTTAALVELLDGHARIVGVFAGETEIDTADDTGPFDCETLGEADEILRLATDEAAPGDLDAAGWVPVETEHAGRLFRVTFPAGEHGRYPLDYMPRPIPAPRSSQKPPGVPIQRAV
ncbi:hypothetical protein ACFWVB_38215 [Streptomyces microflavus]|uniref:hypothetical protein n=1 Tax=Streptomyces microflavus TaxID=1919 RepID=UPI0036513201